MAAPTSFDYIFAAPFSGVFSYKKDSERVIRVHELWKVKIERLDINVARLVFLNNEDEEQADVPKNFALRDATTTADVGRFGNSFFIVWNNSYVLSNAEDIVLHIDNQRQQAICTVYTAIQ
jgi:hypothetical protein